MMRLRFGQATVPFLLVLGGCSTHPLGGSSWQVLDLTTSEPFEYRSITAEFRTNGQLILTTTSPAGEVTVRNRGRYRIDDDTLTWIHPGGQTTVQFKLDDDRLRVESDGFQAVLEPVPVRRPGRRVSVSR